MVKINQTLEEIQKLETLEVFDQEQKDRIKNFCFLSDRSISNIAIDLLYEIIEPEDYFFLTKLFMAKTRFSDRIEVIECMAKINTFQSRLFLRSIAMVGKNDLVKYYAIRCLIEIDPDSVSFLKLDYSKLRSSFRKSLWVYNQFINGNRPAKELADIVKIELAGKERAEQLDWFWLATEVGGDNF